jgi:hypothetical protein
MPFTVPVAPTVATLVEELFHAPPVAELLSAVVLPADTVAMPLIVPAAGVAFIVITLKALEPPTE